LVNAMDIEARIAAAIEAEHNYMSEIVALFVTEMHNDLVREIELAYGKAFAELRLEIANLRLEWQHWLHLLPS
jgi:hypothetical protein